MDGHLPKIKLNAEMPSPTSGYFSPINKRALKSARSVEKINFNKNGFSSPKCVRASHEMLIPIDISLIKKSNNNDSSKSRILNNRRIGDRLLLDSFPTKHS